VLEGLGRIPWFGIGAGFKLLAGGFETLSAAVIDPLLTGLATLLIQLPLVGDALISLAGTDLLATTRFGAFIAALATGSPTSAGAALSAPEQMSAAIKVAGGAVAAQWAEAITTSGGTAADAMAAALSGVGAATGTELDVAATTAGETMAGLVAAAGENVATQWAAAIRAAGGSAAEAMAVAIEAAGVKAGGEEATGEVVGGLGVAGVAVGAGAAGGGILEALGLGAGASAYIAAATAALLPFAAAIIGVGAAWELTKNKWFQFGVPTLNGIANLSSNALQNLQNLPTGSALQISTAIDTVNKALTGQGFTGFESLGPASTQTNAQLEKMLQNTQGLGSNTRAAIQELLNLRNAQNALTDNTSTLTKAFGISATQLSAFADAAGVNLASKLDPTDIKNLKTAIQESGGTVALTGKQINELASALDKMYGVTSKHSDAQRELAQNTSKLEQMFGLTKKQIDALGATPGLVNFGKALSDTKLQALEAVVELDKLPGSTAKVGELAGKMRSSVVQVAASIPKGVELLEPLARDFAKYGGQAMGNLVEAWLTANPKALKAANELRGSSAAALQPLETMLLQIGDTSGANLVAGIMKHDTDAAAAAHWYYNAIHHPLDNLEVELLSAGDKGAAALVQGLINHGADAGINSKKLHDTINGPLAALEKELATHGQKGAANLIAGLIDSANLTAAANAGKTLAHTFVSAFNTDLGGIKLPTSGVSATYGPPVSSTAQVAAYLSALNASKSQYSGATIVPTSASVVHYAPTYNVKVAVPGATATPKQVAAAVQAGLAAHDAELLQAMGAQ
jgi:hypothetical protein